jgi:hypothetical protein
MDTRIGPRGKYFTEVVRTEPVSVMIQLGDSLISGKIHLHPDHRLLDQLNQEPAFLAVTDAQVEKQDETIASSFLAVRRDRILWVIPQDEMTDLKANDAR